MEIQQLKEISSRIYSDVQSLTDADTDALKNILELDTIKYGRIRTFSEEDSKSIILLTLKQNCAILMKLLLKSKIDLPHPLLDSVIKLLIKEDAPQSQCSDPQAVLEKERITKQLMDCIIDILYISEYTNEELKQYLAAKTLPDDVSINLVPLVECEYKSFEMMVLHKLIIGPVLLSVLRAHRNRLRKVVKHRIIDKIKDTLQGNGNAIQYQVFYLINDEKHLDVLKNQPVEHTPEYLGFVSSLIRDKDSAIVAYGKLISFFEEFEAAVSVLLSYTGADDKRIQPGDEEMLYLILESVIRLLRYKSASFYKLIQPAQGLLRLNLGPRLKGLLYDLLSFFTADADVHIELVIECRQELKEEQRTNTFFMLPRLIKFLNEYRRREEVERGPEYFQDQNSESWRKELEYRVAGLRSEDPETLAECLEVSIPADVLKLNSPHIRAAMLKNEAVIARVMEYQLEHKVIIDDVSIVNLISATPHRDFFDYASLFSDFSFYLNENILEQISENLETGMKWMIGCYNREIGIFVRRYSSYFNELLLRNKWIQPLAADLYEKVLADHLRHTSFRTPRGSSSILSVVLLTDGSSKTSFAEDPDILILFDDQDILSKSLFRIFAMQLLHAKFVMNSDLSKLLLKRRYIHQEYPLYVKAKYVVGEDVLADIEFLKKNLFDTDELVGYLTIAGQKGLENKLDRTDNILASFGRVDPSMFLSKFGAASELERFVMLFGVNRVNKSVETLIKDEIMANLRTKNRVYLKMLVMQLFKCSDKDAILRILEKTYEDKTLLLRLNIHNIANGGRYCSKALVAQGSTELVRQALFLLYYLKIWDRSYVAELAGHIDDDGSEEWKYLLADIRGLRY